MADDDYLWCRVRNTTVIEGSSPPLAQTTDFYAVGGVAIAHRSVMLQYFACVGLALTTIVHRFLWGVHVCSAFALGEGE